MKVYKTLLPEITLKFKNNCELKCKIRNSKDAYEVAKKLFDADTLEVCESMIVVFLNRNNTTICWFKVSQGGISSTIVDMKLILATALKCLTSSIIMFHNHPSGNEKPSETDIEITKKIKEGAKLLEINLIDHIIVTGENFYSMADNHEI